jgi:hypothetical protein
VKPPSYDSAIKNPNSDKNRKMTYEWIILNLADYQCMEPPNYKRRCSCDPVPAGFGPKRKGFFAK